MGGPLWVLRRKGPNERSIETGSRESARQAGRGYLIFMECIDVPGAGLGIYTVTPDNSPMDGSICTCIIGEEMGSEMPRDLTSVPALGVAEWGWPSWDSNSVWP